MLKQAILLFVIGISPLSFAAEQVIKEDMTVPSAEGALTAEQIPPIESTAPGKTTQPAASTPQPQQ